MAAVGSDAPDRSARRAPATNHAPDSSLRPRAGYVVDSALPVEESLRRFRMGLGDAPRGLAGGASSRAELVRRFIDALQRSDTAALRRLAVTRVEFAYLVYPSSPYVQPPYRHPVDLAWFQLRAASSRGLTRLLWRAGGPPRMNVSELCDRPPERQGANSLWTGCIVRWRLGDGQEAAARLFGTIIERGGRFKFLSYENQY